MADDIKYIGFNDQIAALGTGGPSTISGVLAVDYTTNTTTGQLKTQNATSTETYTDPPLSLHNGGFLLTTGGDTDPTNNDITITYSGEQPSTATITYALEGAVYSGQNEPVLQLTQAVCFRAGTAIRTPAGDVAVEHLHVGDLVVTTAGEQRPIRWLGHRTIRCAGHASPAAVLPVRIDAHAFGRDRPARDLYVSPGHSICLDLAGEVLIPAAALINGTTITQVDVDTVSYWHVELDSHDIVFAENLPAESYLEMSNRSFFAEAVLVDLAAVPDAAVATVTHADFCRPFHAEGATVQLARAQARAQAETLGWRLVDDGDLVGVHLLVDGVRIDPQIRGRSARFHVPAGARELWLASPTSIPAGFNGESDLRQLGVGLGSVTVDGGFGAPSRTQADDPRLCVGFHDVERDGSACWRWSTARARLPAALWNDIEHDFFLRLDVVMGLPRWIAPAVADEPAVLPARSA